MGHITSKRKSRLVYSFLCFLMAIISALSTTSITHATKLSDYWNTVFKENDIMFWNPYENGGVAECDDPIPDDPTIEDKWDGHCSGVSSYNNWLHKFASTLISIGNANGLPWEAIMAQTIQESGGGSNEVCPYNPLGLKSFKSYPPACDARKHAKFTSYEEAFQYYVDGIIPVREAKNKYPQNPYAYLYFIQHLASHKYAADEHYVNKTSAIVCGIQKWAEANGYPTSAVTYRNYSGGEGGGEAPDGSPGGSGDIIDLCTPEDDEPSTSGEKIARQALRLAWPDSNHHNQVKPEFSQVATQLGNNPTLSWSQDCGHFAGVVIRSTVDTSFPASGSGNMKSYLSSSSKWASVPNIGNTSNLQPGDVFVVSGGSGYGHIFIYTGAAGKNGASASLNDYTGKVVNTVFHDSRGAYSIFRYKG